MQCPWRVVAAGRRHRAEVGKLIVWHVWLECWPLIERDDLIDKGNVGVAEEHAQSLSSSAKRQIYEFEHAKRVLRLQLEHRLLGSTRPRGDVHEETERGEKKRIARSLLHEQNRVNY